MKINKFVGFAAAAALALTPIVAVTTAAQAYPAGQAMTVSSNKYATYAGAEIKVQANRVYPGCKVTFNFYRSGSASATASRQGVTKLTTMYVPSKPGTYTLTAKTKSSCYPPDGFETASATIVVSKKPKNKNDR